VVKEDKYSACQHRPFIILTLKYDAPPLWLENILEQLFLLMIYGRSGYM
jgi:hypothetical protein